ncbi:hypothetical protein ACFV2Q_19990 [Streptomyces sp. NPDC059650]|uniref:hypothetical protein n=1 Tax=Streptomyces sp. NPDC059650 TaxID=3346896 RepID=UPI0036C60720
MASVDGNLKYNLLMHRRLFLTDASILLSPPVLQLLSDPESAYRIFLQDGSIVPAVRSSADSFTDVASQIIRSGNYAELTEDEIRFYADRLDGARPHIVHTDPSNQDLMNDLAGEVLMQPEYWTQEIERPFDRDLAHELVRSVMTEMHDEGRGNFRQTEFWNFAETLHARNIIDLAQVIRIEATIHSLGVMAINFNLPLVVPAPYAQPAGRIYGTGSPVREVGDTVELTGATEGEISEGKRAIYLLAQELTPQQIYEIRQSVEFENYIRSLEKADGIGKDSLYEAPMAEGDIARDSAALLEKAFLGYREDLNTLGPVAAEGGLPHRRFLQKTSKVAKVGGLVAPIPVGWVAHRLSYGSSVSPDLVTNLARAGTAAFVWVVNKYGPSRMLHSEETRAQRTQMGIRRDNHVKVEFFGPVDARYWWLYEEESPEA